jgi:hypothetical protein
MLLAEIKAGNHQSGIIPAAVLQVLLEESVQIRKLTRDGFPGMTLGMEYTNVKFLSSAFFQPES